MLEIIIIKLYDSKLLGVPFRPTVSLLFASRLVNAEPCDANINTDHDVNGGDELNYAYML